MLEVRKQSARARTRAYKSMHARTDVHSHIEIRNRTCLLLIRGNSGFVNALQSNVTLHWLFCINMHRENPSLFVIGHINRAHCVILHFYIHMHSNVHVSAHSYKLTLYKHVIFSLMFLKYFLI
jgi:hypothetical protein